MQNVKSANHHRIESTGARAHGGVGGLIACACPVLLYYMKRMAIILLTVLVTGLATAADTTNVTAIIKGKHVEFSSDVRAQIVLKSVDLLASCGYMDAQSKLGAPAEPQSIGDAQKQSHLHLVFSRAHKVAIPTEKVTLQVR